MRMQCNIITYLMIIFQEHTLIQSKQALYGPMHFKDLLVYTIESQVVVTVYFVSEYIICIK